MLDVTPFFSTDELRPAICGIIYDGEWANATNAHIAIRWPHISTVITDKAPNIKKLFDEREETESFVFDKNEYRQWVKTLPLVKDILECKECEGYGRVEWTYVSRDGKEFTKNRHCPVCDGKGEWNTSKMVPDKRKNYTTSGGVVFSQVHLEKVLLVMDYAKVDTCYFSRSINIGKGCVVNIDMYQILIMPIIL